jgi:hypothetical protein
MIKETTLFLQKMKKNTNIIERAFGYYLKAFYDYYEAKEVFIKELNKEFVKHGDNAGVVSTDKVVELKEKFDDLFGELDGFKYE